MIDINYILYHNKVFEEKVDTSFVHFNGTLSTKLLTKRHHPSIIKFSIRCVCGRSGICVFQCDSTTTVRIH